MLLHIFDWITANCENESRTNIAHLGLRCDASQHTSQKDKFSEGIEEGQLCAEATVVVAFGV